MSEYHLPIWFRSVWNKVKAFFVTRDALTFLVFLLLSTAFWFVHALDRVRETQITLQLSYVGIPDNVLFVDQSPTSVNIKIKDEGKNLFAYRKNRLPLIAFDLSDSFTAEQGKVIITKEEIRKKISMLISGTTDILAINPDTIALNYIKQSQKEVPVRIAATLLPARQYMIRDTLLQNKTVLLFGMASQLAGIHEISTQNLIYSEIKDSTRLTLPLQIPKGIRVGTDKVNCIVIAEKFTEKKMKVNIEAVNFPSDINVRIFPAEAEVTCNIPLSEFSSLQPDDIKVFIDYHDVKPNTAQVELSSETDKAYISKIKIYPSEVEFLLEEKNVMSEDETDTNG